MNLGPLMLDVAGYELSQEEREILQHPACGGVILFARNYHDVEQVRALADSIHRLRDPQLLIAVDQEGGRVQRFRQGFLQLPPLLALGRDYADNPLEACRRTQDHAWLMAAETLAAGVDFSFAPVLDIDYGHSAVIGDRALHTEPEAIAALGKAYIDGMHRAGMAAVGKHFPGHGFVAADSHTDLPVDERSFDEIEAADLLPFRELAGQGLDAVMPAHVIYAECDARPAGFSPFWLREILRGQLGFTGVIFSDDLSMQAAHSVGAVEARAALALEAGCDMLLVCNDPAAAIEVLESLEAFAMTLQHQQRLATMRRRAQFDWQALHQSKQWQTMLATVETDHGRV